MVLEVCAYSVQSCMIAAGAGAGRIELCTNPAEGGVTPSIGMVTSVLDLLSIPVFPMVRPRGGNFVYDEQEIDIMRRDILALKQVGCKGIATGASLPTGQLDVETIQRLVAWAWPMQVTCHKVYDQVPDPFEALEVLIGAGCTRVLTSGLQRSAPEGAMMIKELIKRAAGRIAVMPGGGVRSGNIAEIARLTGAKEFHSSALLPGRGYYVADATEVGSMCAILG